VAVYTNEYPSSTLSLPYVLAPGEYTVVTVTVQAPSDAVNGMVDIARVAATGSLGGRDTVTDTTTVVVPPPRWDVYLPLVLRQFIQFPHSPAGD
jgi:hypothetical protein